MKLIFSTAVFFVFALVPSILYYAGKAYEEPGRKNYTHGIAESFSHKAAVELICENNFKELERLARESLKWFELTSNKKRIEVAYFQLAKALFSQYRYDEASPYLEQSQPFYSYQ